MAMGLALAHAPQGGGHAKPCPARRLSSAGPGKDRLGPVAVGLVSCVQLPTLLSPPARWAGPVY